MSENKYPFGILSGDKPVFSGTRAMVYAWLKDQLRRDSEYDVVAYGTTYRVDARTFVKNCEAHQVESIDQVMEKLTKSMDRQLAIRKLVGMAMVSAVRIQSSDVDRSLKHIAVGKKLEEITQQILEVFAENEEQTGE